MKTFLFGQNEGELKEALECARNGNPCAEKVLEEMYRKHKDLWRYKAGEPENDYWYHYYADKKCRWQENVMELRCANNRRELTNLKSQLTDAVEAVGRLTQKLEESNARIREMGSKLDLLLTFVNDLAEKQYLEQDNERMKQTKKLEDLASMNKELAAKQERLIEDNEGMKQQLEESNANNSRTTKKLEDLASMNKEFAAKKERLIEDNARMKQQIEESNNDKHEMGCKLQLMLEVIQELTEKQQHMIEESARMKKEVEESNTQLKEISQKFKDISTEQKICEEDVRMKNPKETFTEGRGKESEQRNNVSAGMGRKKQKKFEDIRSSEPF